MARRRTTTAVREFAKRPPVIPRLLRRAEAALYLAISPSQLDLLRNRGAIRNVPIPSDRAPGGVSRVPVFDRADLDQLIEQWKASRAS